MRPAVAQPERQRRLAVLVDHRGPPSHRVVIVGQHARVGIGDGRKLPGGVIGIVPGLPVRTRIGLRLVLRVVAAECGDGGAGADDCAAAGADGD